MLKNCVTKSVLILSVLLPLTGCDRAEMLNMRKPTEVTINRVELHKGMGEAFVAYDQIDFAWINDIARDYSYEGVGSVQLDVSYKPDGKGDSIVAAQKASKIADQLRQKGISDINTRVVPLEYDDTYVRLSYARLEARPPEGCGELPGGDGAVWDVQDYKLGCSIETRLARQIVRPKDLAGKASRGTGDDGRRQASIVDRYRSGEPVEDLQEVTVGSSATGATE